MLLPRPRFVAFLLFFVLSASPGVRASTLDISNRWSFKAITQDCYEKANENDCSVFNRCCDFRCQQFVGYSSKAHFCMSILGKIIPDRTECICNSAVSPLRLTGPRGWLAKLDIVAGVILIFVVDIVLISFVI